MSWPIISVCEGSDNLILPLSPTVLTILDISLAVFSAVICVLGIGLCLFVFLTFNSDQTPIDNEQSKPVPITSSVNSVSRLRNERQNNFEVADNAENKENEENKNN